MKTRLDFVSNSSTSCYFVVTKRPVYQYTIREFKRLFKNKKLAEPIHDKLKDAHFHRNSKPGNYVYVCMVNDDTEEMSRLIYEEYKNNSKVIKLWDDLCP